MEIFRSDYLLEQKKRSRIFETGPFSINSVLSADFQQLIRAAGAEAHIFY